MWFGNFENKIFFMICLCFLMILLMWFLIVFGIKLQILRIVYDFFCLFMKFMCLNDFWFFLWFLIFDFWIFIYGI